MEQTRLAELLVGERVMVKPFGSISRETSGIVSHANNQLRSCFITLPDGRTIFPISYDNIRKYDEQNG